MSTMNFYVVLGIAEDADSDTIRSAFGMPRNCN